MLAAIFTAMLATKAAMLSLEVQGKQTILQSAWQRMCPESTSGILNRSVFWWLNDLMREGFLKTLSVETLYEPDKKLESRRLLHNLEKSWGKTEKDKATLTVVDHV